MDNIRFVEIINTNVRESAIQIVKADLENTESKYPIIADLAKWYSSKNQDEKEIISNLITRVYDCAAFRILCMLDGVSYRESLDSSFELNYIEGDSKTKLIDPERFDELHDLYQADFKVKGM